MLDSAGPDETVLVRGMEGVVTLLAKSSPSKCSVKGKRGEDQKTEQVFPPTHAGASLLGGGWQEGSQAEASEEGR